MDREVKETGNSSGLAARRVAQRVSLQLGESSSGNIESLFAAEWAALQQDSGLSRAKLEVEEQEDGELAKREPAKLGKPTQQEPSSSTAEGRLASSSPANRKRRRRRRGASVGSGGEPQNGRKRPVINALLRGNMQLDCNLTPPDPEDSVSLVLWYKDNSMVPIYR